MSGFLQRLALRESGAAPSIAPRLPSWFERSGSPPAGEPDAPSMVMPSSPDRPARMPVPVPVTSAAVQAALSVATPAGPQLVPNGPPVTPALAPRAAALNPTQRQATQLPALLVPPQAREAVKPGVQEERRPVAAAVMADSKIANADRADQTFSQAAQSPRGKATPSLPPVSGTLATRPPVPSQQPALQARLARLAPEVLAAARAADTVRAAPQVLAVPPVPDTIAVTIGRLEVRAVQAAKPAPQQTRSVQSPTSLDDYLAKRNGEARR